MKTKVSICMIDDIEDSRHLLITKFHREIIIDEIKNNLNVIILVYVE